MSDKRQERFWNLAATLISVLIVVPGVALLPSSVEKVLALVVGLGMGLLIRYIGYVSTKH